ncbi:Transmembrane domain-containing protein [Spironucleus salmonicida]|uniref:Transmembrane domain-containing protein n=1 Tax=Spironucleus salmonicida TaxID=348837 RepID=A0A9P8RZE4_9EUKA|nr:Transmembrane domain-containing protein [Spironucleus salmonicida]
MHIYYQTPIKILLYILQYCIVINHYASTTHACLSTIYGNTWGSSTSGTHFSSRQLLKIEYKQSSAQPVLALLVRIPFLVYCAPGLISEYILVSIVVYSINTIVYTKYPYKHHSQCIYTTKLQLRYSYIYYSIVYSSSTIPVPLTPALVLSMELLGVQYQWCPLQQQIVIKDRIYKQSSAQPVLVLYRQEYPSQCTVHLGSQVNIYQQAQQYIIQIQQYILNILIGTHSQCIYTTKLQLRYSYIYYSIALSSITIPVPLTPALVLSMELLGVAVLVVPTSVADSYQRQNTNSLRHSLCLYSTGKNTLPSVLCTWAHK